MTEEARAEPVWPFAFFVQNIDWAIEGRWGAGMMVPTWSLAVEEQFYLILPLLIRFCPPKALPALLSGLIVAAPLFRDSGSAIHTRHIFSCRAEWTRCSSES